MTDAGLPPMNHEAATPPAHVSPGPSPVPAGLGGWMTFVGIMTILSGILQILSCVGIIGGILNLVAGISVIGARSALEGLQIADARLMVFFSKLKTFFVCTGWVYLIGIIIGVVILLIWGGAIFAAMVAAIAEAQ